jgi:integrase
MGSVFKKTYTKPLRAGAEVLVVKGERVAKWKTAKGKSRSAPVIVGRDGNDRITGVAATYTAKYRDGQGRLREVATGCKDATAARRKLADLEKRADQVRSGMRTAAEDAVIDHQATPLMVHVEDYLRSQTTKGRSGVSIKNARARLKRIVADQHKDGTGGCGFTTLVDLNATVLEAWLETQRAAGMSAGNSNEFRQAMIGFCNWCAKASIGRLATNPLNSVPVADTRTDCRRKRRALTETELGRLLDSARRRPLTEALTVRRGKNKGQLIANVRPEVRAELDRLGCERALIYKTLLLTGLRKNELATLKVNQLELEGKTPHLQLDAADEKNREGNAIPLRADLVADLRLWLTEKRTSARRADELLFDVPKGMLRILDRDLAHAGIPKKDERGRTVDIHAMRHTFVTLLSKGGVAPRTAQAAARHSDITLTMQTYTDPRLLDVQGALDVLPALTLEPVAVREKSVTSDGVSTGVLATGLAMTSDARCQRLAKGVKDAVEAALEFVPPTDDLTVTPVNKNSPLTTSVNGLQVVERKGVEPSTSALRTQRSPN